MKKVNKALRPVFERMEVEPEAMVDLMSRVALGRDVYDLDENGNEVKISNEQANEKIYEFALNVFDLDEEDLKNSRAVSRAIKHHSEEFFEIIEDTIEEAITSGWNDDPFFNEYVEVKNGALGDENRFYTEEETILTVSEVAGDHHYYTIQRLGYGSSFSVKTATYGAMVGADIKKYLLGQVDWVKLVLALMKAFDQKYKEAIYNEFLAVGNKLPSSITLNAAIDTTASGAKDSFDTIVDNVRVMNNGADVVIMGLASDLNKLKAFDDVAWRSNAAKDDLYKTGRLGYYEGIELIEIPQQIQKKNGEYSRMVEAGHLYIFSKGFNDKFIKVFRVGNMTTRQVDNIGDYYDDKMTLEAVETYGVATILGKYFGHVKIS